jgi:hypothetical protein
LYKEDYKKIVDFELSDEEFMEIAEKHGLVWSLKGFEHDYNINDIKEQIIIRFIQL